VLRTPVQAPKANAFCERLIGTVRRECLDYVIPLSEKHLRKTLREWVSHYNHGRPHSALGPGLPADTKARLRRFSPHTRRHELPADSRITTREILGGLHHEYELARIAA
jgi:putative transposase